MSRTTIEKLKRIESIEKIHFENVIICRSNYYSLEQSYRVYKDKKLGVYGCEGECNDENMLLKAKQNLVLSKKYIPKHSN